MGQGAAARLASLGLLVVTLLAGAAPARGQTPPHAPDEWFLDQAGVLSSSHRDDLRRTIWSLEHDTGAELGVLIGRSSGRLDAQEYARRVFASWKLGKRGRDNGVLLLLLVSDREVRILPGTGYKQLLDEEAAGRILDEEVVPCLKRGDHGGAVVAGARRIAAEVRRREGAPDEPTGQVAAPARAFGGAGLAAPHHATPPTPVRHDVEAGGSSHDTPVTPSTLTPHRTTSTAQYVRHQGFVERTLHKVGGVVFWGLIVAAVIGLAILLRPKCPRCATYLHTYSRTLVSATYHSSGRGERTLDCPKCHYHRVEVYTIPTKTRHRSSSSRSSFGSSFGGSSRSSGGGGSSFGGGRSSGGGAGRSW